MKRIKKDDVLALELSDGSYGFGLSVYKGTMVLFDLLSNKIEEVDLILQSSILFHTFFIVIPILL